MSQGYASAEGPGARATLRELVAAVEEAPPVTPEARSPMHLWCDLVEGRWRLVERFERGGRRYYVAYESPRGASAPQGLTRQERMLVALIGSGESEKVAGYALGVGPSALCGLLKTALAKLGIRSRTDLVLFMRAVGLSREEICETGDF